MTWVSFKLLENFKLTLISDIRHLHLHIEQFRGGKHRLSLPFARTTMKT